MKLYIKRPKAGINAAAIYDDVSGSVVVLKGSRISCKITNSKKFRGVRSLEKSRAEYVEDGVVVRDAEFKSSSTAANFVTGTSTNGLKAWKDESGRTLKAILSNKEIQKDE